MQSSRYIHCFSLFAYLCVAVGLSEFALMAWLTVDHHEVSSSIEGSGQRVVLHHHTGNHESVTSTAVGTDEHFDHILDMPDQADTLVPASILNKVELAKVALTTIPAALSQIHTTFSLVSQLSAQPPPLSRNQTLSFFRTILLLI